MEVLPLKSNEIESSLKSGKMVVGMVGLGWMGFPLAMLFADAGATVRGAMLEDDYVHMLNSGKSHISESGVQALLERALAAGRFRATTDVTGVAKESDVLNLIVPTLIDDDKKPDYSAVVDASRNIGRGIKKGSLVIFSSTAAPGTTETLVGRTIEEASGLKAGVDFGLAYSPIRGTAGRVLKDLQSYKRIVGGIDVRSTELAVAVLSQISKEEIIRVANPKTAEAVKLFENVYRDVNIALANELARYCEREGIDYFEAQRAAVTQPYCHLHLPGAGVGGHCIPVNPYFLLERAEHVEVGLRMVRLAREVNDSMPLHMVELLEEGLRECGKKIDGAKLSVLGIAFREDVKESRYSPALVLGKALVRRGAHTVFHDPNFTAAEIGKMGLEAADTFDECVEKSDAIIIVTRHSWYTKLTPVGLAKKANMPAVVVDGRNLFNPGEVTRAGFIYRSVGGSGASLGRALKLSGGSRKLHHSFT